MNIASKIAGLPRTTALALSIISLLLVGVFDYLTGPELAFSIFYLAPISFALWYAGFSAGLGLSIAGTGIWLYLDITAGLQYESRATHYWNALVRLGFFVVVTLVLEARKRAEHQLRRAKEEAEHLAAQLQNANREIQQAIAIKSKFTSMVSHELRTPLAAIKEGVGIVLDGTAGDINSDQREFLALAKRNVDRLHRLINDVLDFAKLQSGKMKYNKEAVDVCKLVTEAVDSQRAHASSKKLSISVSFDDRLPLAHCDADKIQQVLVNLLNNAIKFTETGGVSVHVGLQERSVLVCVRDTGIGISKDNIERIFHQFEQANGESFRKPGSTGLGLAICKEIIEAHGGRIWAESDGEHGSEFYFTLPSGKESNHDEQANSHH